MGGAPVEEGDQPISHGLCSSCERDLTAQLGTPIERFLESLAAPVILIDVGSGGRFAAANVGGLRVVGTSTETSRGRLMGQVFECAHASLPEGCGRTIHCSGCTARIAVERTWETGEPAVRIPATLLPEGSEARVEMEISTERIGDHVLLRIDRPPTPIQ